VGSALRPDLRQYAEAAQATPGDKWYMGEVFVRIRGKQQLFGARSTRTEM
jgi:hypothetical protein